MKGGIDPTAVIGRDGQWRKYLDETEEQRIERYMDNCPVIHHTARVGPLTQIDSGCIRPTVIGADTFVMGMVHVGHGVQIGSHCDIASGTIIAGEVTIGNHVRIGIGAKIAPFKTIGDHARIGAGAVVVKDVPAYECWAGNPAKRLYSYCPKCLGKLTGNRLSSSPEGVRLLCETCD